MFGLFKRRRRQRQPPPPQQPTAVPESPRTPADHVDLTRELQSSADVVLCAAGNRDSGVTVWAIKGKTHELEILLELLRHRVELDKARQAAAAQN